MTAAAFVIALAACGDNWPPGTLYQSDGYCCGSIAVDNGYVFFNAIDAVQRVPVAGGSVQTLVESTSIHSYTIQSVRALATYEDQLVFEELDTTQDDAYYDVTETAGKPEPSTLSANIPFCNGLCGPDTLAIDTVAMRIYAIWPGFPMQPFLADIVDAGNWKYGGIVFDADTLFVTAPFEPQSGTQVYAHTNDVSTRIAIFPSKTLERVAADDQYIYAVGTSGVVQVARADGSVTVLDTTPVADIIDIAGVVYTLDTSPAIVRYDSGGPTPILEIDPTVDVTHGRIATDGQRVFYTGTIGAEHKGFIRYVDL